MKNLSFLLGFLMLCFAELVFANAEATTVNGTVSAQSGTTPARAVRQGDIVRQGETVSTGAASAAVLRFDDGQVVALGANSRMAITTYEYNPQSSTGSILLSLLDGGMRAVTGLIGRRSPSQVAYRAATATIGIRGTDTSIFTSNGAAAALMHEGQGTFTSSGRSANFSAGEGVDMASNGQFQVGSISTVLSRLGQTPQGRQMLNANQSLNNVSPAVSDAVSRGPRETGPGPTGQIGPTPGPTGQVGGTGGGGTASPR